MLTQRIGIGYDVHRLADGRRLILGGVEIEYEKGLLGHSDADVLVHAIIDAMLGAAGKGDIGMHFPDTSPEFEGADSIILLKKVNDMLLADGYRVVNIDSVIVAQKPRLSAYIYTMTKNISATLGIDRDQVSVKAKTEEGLGFTGTGQGMAAQAVCMVCRP